MILKDLHTGEKFTYDSTTKLYKTKDNKMQVKVVTNLDTNQIQLTPKLLDYGKKSHRFVNLSALSVEVNKNEMFNFILTDKSP